MPKKPAIAPPPAQKSVEQKRSPRSQELYGACLSFLAYHKAWEDGPLQVVGDDWCDQLDDLIDVFHAGDTPRDCRKLDDLVMEIEDVAGRFYTRRETPDAPALTPFELFSKIRELKEIVEKETSGRPKWPPLESLELLDKQGVSHAQIALIYGFCPKGEELNANRYAYIVAGELKERGSIVDWSQWRDPREVEADDNDRSLTARKRLRSRGRTSGGSIESMVNQGKSVSEICNTLGCSEGEVIAAMSRLSEPEAVGAE